MKEGASSAMLDARSTATALGQDRDIRCDVPVGALLAPQPKARGETRGRRRTASQKKQYMFYIRHMCQCFVGGGGGCGGVLVVVVVVVLVVSSYTCLFLIGSFVVCNWYLRYRKLLASWLAYTATRQVTSRPVQPTHRTLYDAVFCFHLSASSRSDFSHASRLVQVMPAWSVKTRVPRPRVAHRDVTVYSHTITAMHEMSTPPPYGSFQEALKIIWEIHELAHDVPCVCTVLSRL